MQKLCKVVIFHKQLLGMYLFKNIPNEQASPKCTNSSECIAKREVSAEKAGISENKLTFPQPCLP